MDRWTDTGPYHIPRYTMRVAQEKN